MTQSMRQVFEWENRRRASEVTSSPRDGDTLSALGQHHQPPRWSAGRPHHTSSLFGAGCFLLGEASAMADLFRLWLYGNECINRSALVRMASGQRHGACVWNKKFNFFFLMFVHYRFFLACFYLSICHTSSAMVHPPFCLCERLAFLLTPVSCFVLFFFSPFFSVTCTHRRH